MKGSFLYITQKERRKCQAKIFDFLLGTSQALHYLCKQVKPIRGEKCGQCMGYALAPDNISYFIYGKG